jgi:hypothetical protein
MAQVVRVAAEPRVGQEHMANKKLKFLFLLLNLVIKIILKPKPILQYKMPFLDIIKTLVIPLLLWVVFIHILVKFIHYIEWQTDQILYIIQTNRAQGHYR